MKCILKKYLQVLYRPRVTVGPVSEYAVEEGQMVQLTCAADANPSQPSFQWYGLTDCASGVVSFVDFKIKFLVTLDDSSNLI